MPIVIGVIIVLIILLVVRLSIKKIRFDTIVMLNGAVGSGKSSTSLYLCLKQLRKKKIKYWIDTKIFRKKNKEKPLLYSNVPLYNVEYCHIDNNDIINRKSYRFAYNSIIYLNEASLMACSQDYKDIDLNDRLTCFVKLIRHELRGNGMCLVMDTQSPDDLHYSADRNINKMLFITRSINWVPFFRFVWVREMSRNINNTINESESDFIDDNNDRFILVPKSIFKKYNSHCYSFLTDNLPVYNNAKIVKSKKPKFEKFFIPTYSKKKEIEVSNASLKENDKNEKK